MTDLSERAQAAALDRVRSVRSSLDAVTDPTDRALDEALRELHAIKGETAMVGLRDLSRLVHGLESLILARRRSSPFYLEDVRGALCILSDLLSSTPTSELAHAQDIEDLIVEVEAAVEALEGSAPATRGTRAVPRVARDPTIPPPPEGESPTPSDAPPASPQGDTGARRGAWFRVEARSIDELSHLISEVTTQLDSVRNQVGNLGALSREERRARQILADQLDTIRARVAMAEERAWALRLVAISPLLDDLNHHARVLAQQLGKRVKVESDGGGVALERGVVEALREPLLHLVRNAIDHGIEARENRGDKPPAGLVRLRAESLSGEVVIVVEDDGAGLEVDRLRQRAIALELISPERGLALSREETLELAFLTGLSRHDVATELSGRGVGLAAVRSVVESLGGAVSVQSVAGRGTRFELALPAAVARERALVVESAGLPWAIPSRWVRTVLRDEKILEQARHARSMRLQTGWVPVRPLSAWLRAPREEEGAAVVVDIAGRGMALMVARVLHEMDLLRTPTDALLASATRIAASGTLADGRAVFFLRWAEVLREVTSLADDSASAPEPGRRAPRVLVVDDSPVIRDIVGEVLSNAGIEVVPASDGKVAIELLERQSFDLVVSDIEMPRVDGLELLRSIRGRSETLPVVMLTTRNKPEHRREAALLGANAYIAKSEFHGDTLLEVIRRFVDLPQ